MITLAGTVQFFESDSVLEALILEANLIKKYRPEYNSREKDDKSFIFVVITKEEFPKVILVRGKELDEKMRNNSRAIFGPYPSAGEIREALKIIRKIFPFRDKKCNPNSLKPCFNRQIKLCPGVCSGEISASEYLKIVKNIELFFEGKKKAVLRSLEAELKLNIKKGDFERAVILRNQIFALNHIQDIALIKHPTHLDAGRPSGIERKIEGYDIAHTSGKQIVGVVIALVNGEPAKQWYRTFKIKTLEGANDTAALRELILRRLAHNEWPAPDLIVVDGGKAQKNVVEMAIIEASKIIPVVSVVKDKRHKPREILGDSAIIKDHHREIILADLEANRFAVRFHRKLRDKIPYYNSFWPRVPLGQKEQSYPD